MIEFRGDVCSDIKAIYLDKAAKKLSLFLVIVFVCFSPVMGFVAYTLSSLKMFWVYPLVVCIHYIGTRFLYKKINKKMKVQRVRIEGEYLFAKTTNDDNRINLKFVKKVIDYGDFYLIVLPKYLPILDVICQKSLLVKGSLEEFETLFQNIQKSD